MILRRIVENVRARDWFTVKILTTEGGPIYLTGLDNALVKLDAAQ